MKRSVLLLFSILSTNLFLAYGQLVNEVVDFDNYVSPTNNDFANHFNNGLGLAQITTNGITGGCLTVPATMNWGNDNAIYCSKYVADSASLCKTHISFKYDTTVFNSSGFDRAVSIFLRPSADFNHYIIASVSHSQRIEILTYSWTNSPGPLLNLVHNHWYEFTLRVTFTGGAPGDQVDINSSIDDLGISGQNLPILVNTASGTFNDSILFGDTAVEVSLTATQNGGVKYIDNFQFEGIKSADSCISIPTNIPEKSAENFSAFISGNELIIKNEMVSSGEVAEIFTVSGKKIYSAPLTGQESRVNISDFGPGVYFVRLRTAQASFVRKIAVLR
jgi:hypothetical protein